MHAQIGTDSFEYRTEIGRRKFLPYHGTLNVGISLKEHPNIEQLD
jgi:hypothetical protein